MSADIKLDPATGDIDVGATDLVLIYDDDALIQRLKIRFQDSRGDWFRDTTYGTDWFGSILGKRSNLVRRAEFRRVAMGTEGVGQVSRLDMVYTGSTRDLVVDITVVKETGGTLDIRFEDLI